MTTMVDQTHRWDYAECPSWRPSTARWVLLPGQYVSIWLSENMCVRLCMYSMQLFAFPSILAPYRFPIHIVGGFYFAYMIGQTEEREIEREKRSRTTMESTISASTMQKISHNHPQHSANARFSDEPIAPGPGAVRCQISERAYAAPTTTL